MSEPRFQTREGKATTADDPERLMWYSALGSCGYWTDDWTKPLTWNGIPCCPQCHSVGMQTTVEDWDKGVAGYAKEYPHYAEFVAAAKETCGRRIPWMDRYQQFAKGQQT